MKLNDFVLCDDTVACTAEVHAATMLVLLMTGK